jgi:hypothetical protein
MKYRSKVYKYRSKACQAGLGRERELGGEECERVSVKGIIEDTTLSLSDSRVFDDSTHGIEFQDLLA